MRLPQWMRHIWAEVGGYFWLPCPICGQMFGGFEAAGTWHDGPGEEVYNEEGRWIGGWNTGVGVCPSCVTEADRRNMAGEYNTVPKEPSVYDLERRLKAVEDQFAFLRNSPTPTDDTAMHSG